MSDLFDRIQARPTSQKIGLWVGTLLIMSYFFYQYFYSEQLQEHTNLTDKIDTLTTQIAQERRLARNLSKFVEEVKELDIKLKFALQELPNEREIPDLLSSVSGLIRDAGLQSLLFKPNPELHKGFYAEVPVSVSIEGTYHQVATFFDEVGQLPRIININQITVRDPIITDEAVTIKADCVATTFRYLDEKERIQVPEETDKRKRRKR